MSDWTVTGSEGLPILGDTDSPRAQPVGAALIVHGFKGYKDYGMFPVLGRALADAGVLAHRFNLAHSGMTDQLETFERPDLFERDTWAFQAEDVAHVARAVSAGTLPGRGLPMVLIGHSRGGVTALLAAARRREDLFELSGVVTINAPAETCSLSAEDRRRLLDDGSLESPSARTKQALRVGRAWLQTQLDDPAWHDVLDAAASIDVPMLVIQGDADRTVDPASAGRIASRARHARRVMIPGGDHVLNTPNPAPVGGPPSPALAGAIDAIGAFCREILAADRR
ncbi:MAG: alpha/beta fold hydrolase [Phycisphaerales bacterium]